MNACSFCKRGKRKCNKARPSCSNCLRLHKICVYTEDSIQTHFYVPDNSLTPFEHRKLQLTDSLAGLDFFRHETFQQSIAALAKRLIGSSEELHAISTEFFVGTHQRIPTLSKFRFYDSLPSWNTGPRADFATLCLSILLIQQMPSSKMTNVRSPLYFAVKNFINLLEASDDLSMDLAHCRVLVAFYEMGHGLHRAAYLSVAACARTARALGLHRTMRRHVDINANKLTVEEEKRTWWAIVIMDRFINLCNGDALFATDDPQRTDPLPVEDLLWSESSTPADLEVPISTPPSLDTPFNTTVGQMARECQISHLAGRVVRHVFDPVPDGDFNVEEGFQLERTLKSYLPLLANEELRIGKYCGAFGVCNSALFILYEFMLSRNSGNNVERNRIFRSIEETSLSAITFAEASYSDRAENYPTETISPYLPYSLCQAAIVQHRLWKQNGDPMCKRHLDSLKTILKELARRWMVAWQYLDLLDNLNDDWPSIAFPFQGLFINTGRPTITA